MPTFRITKDYYEEGVEIFPKASVKINPGLTVLIGCNGSGKSTLLQCLRGIVEKREDAAVFYYSNLTDGGTRALSAAIWMNDISRAATGMVSSEGELIVQNLGHQASRIGSFIRKNRDYKELYILLDALDSGSSLDNIRNMKQDFFNLVLEDCKRNGKDVFIIVAANSFEMAKGEDCLDVSTMKHVTPKTYDTYAKLIMASRERKEELYAKFA